MFTMLDGSEGDVLGVEISGGYTREDMEAFREAYEKVMQNHAHINILCKVDEMSVTGSEFKALWEDSIYALKHLKDFRHLAIVGNSKVTKILIELDNVFFGNKSRERIEKYFDVDDLDEAWKFVRS